MEGYSRVAEMREESVEQEGAGHTHTERSMYKINALVFERVMRCVYIFVLLDLARREGGGESHRRSCVCAILREMD
jgi:hypothetical protein